MSVIFCCKSGCGGYGDRLVGLITVYYISKILEKEFYIEWDNCKSNFDQFLDIKTYPYDASSFPLIHLIDGNAFKEIDFFSTGNLKEKYQNENMKFFCNQNLVYYLYKNPNYSNLIMENYESEISLSYKKIYDEFLKPKNFLKETVNNFIYNFKEHENIIGIHIRAGDSYLVGGNHVYLNSDGIKFVLEIYYQYLTKNYNNYAIYLMSDYPNINKLFEEKFNGVKIFYHDKLPIHIDMIQNDDNIYEGTFKLLLDHITFTKCKIVISHSNSNLGKTASLISDAEKYSFGYITPTIEKTTITHLSSKMNLV